MAVNYNAEPILTVDGLKQLYRTCSRRRFLQNLSWGNLWSGWRVRFRKVHHRKKCHPPL